MMSALDGSTSRTILLLVALVASSLLCWAGKVDAQAYVAVVSLIVGGVVHASGTRQGSEASQAPPPAE